MQHQIGSRIAQLRMKQGLTQAQMAAGICNRSHISMIERGLRVPSFTLLDQLAGRLRITLPDLLGDITPPSREASFSFDLLIEHVESLLVSAHYLDACILIRKHLRHPDIAVSPSKLSQLHRCIGIAEALLLAPDRALESLTKAQRYAEECRDIDLQVYALISLAALHNKTGRHRDAEHHYKEAAQRLPKEAPLVTQTKIQVGLGLALHGQGQARAALGLFKQRLQHLIKANSLYLIGELHTCIGDCLQKMNNPQDAILFYEKAVGSHTLTDNHALVADACLRIAACCEGLNQHETAAAYRARAQTASPGYSADRIRDLPLYRTALTF